MRRLTATRKTLVAAHAHAPQVLLAPAQLLVFVVVEEAMVDQRRAPAWIMDHLVITDDPEVVTDVFRRQLQLF